MADTVGKGLQAALIAAGLHAIFHTSAESPLSESVAAADRYLRRFLSDSSFVTFAAVELDPLSRRGLCVNCGHPPIFAVSSAGTRELPGGNHLPLGLGLEKVKCVPMTLGPGEWIVGYTDGLTELSDPSGEFLGIERLQQLLAKECAGTDAGPAEAIAARITASLDAYGGNRRADDDRTFFIARPAISIDGGPSGSGETQE